MSVQIHKGLWILKCENASIVNKALGIQEINRLFFERVSAQTVAFLDRDKDKVKSILRKEGIGFKIR